MALQFSSTQRVSKNTRLSTNIAEALIKALGINTLNNGSTVEQIASAITEKLNAIGSGVTADTLLTILSDAGNVQGTKVEGEVALNTMYITVSDVKAMTDDQLDILACGDVVVKEDTSGKHAYIVTYKKDKHGICMSYFDASCIETVSYDYTNGHWVYNSMDLSYIPLIEDKTDYVQLNYNGQEFKLAKYVEQ